MKLDNKQFHHYLANLMLSALIYDSAVWRYDLARLAINTTSKLKRRKPDLSIYGKFEQDLKRLPEYFLSIIFLFSTHISRLAKDQHELSTSFSERLNKVQFMKT